MAVWDSSQLIKNEKGTITGVDCLGWTIPVYKALNSHHWEKGVHDEIADYEDMIIIEVPIKDSVGTVVFWYYIIPVSEGIRKIFDNLNRDLHDRDIIIDQIKDHLWTEMFHTFYPKEHNGNLFKPSDRAIYAAADVLGIQDDITISRESFLSQDGLVRLKWFSANKVALSFARELIIDKMVRHGIGVYIIDDIFPPAEYLVKMEPIVSDYNYMIHRTDEYTIIHIINKNGIVGKCDEFLSAFFYLTGGKELYLYNLFNLISGYPNPDQTLVQYYGWCNLTSRYLNKEKLKIYLEYLFFLAKGFKVNIKFGEDYEIWIEKAADD